MRTMPVKVANAQGVWSFRYLDLLVQVARDRLKQFDVERRQYSEEEAIEWAKAVGADDLEDLFLLRHLSVDLTRRQPPLLFYQENHEGWCFEHMMYQTEERHKEMFHE